MPIAARRALPLAAVFLVAAAPLAAQIGEDGEPQPSQHGTVSQTLATAVITLEYDRPVARGRTLFGPEGLVESGEVWTPGANRATWVDFSVPVAVEGRELAAGRYGIWAVPADEGPWEVVLVSEWDAFHRTFPEDSEVARFRVEPETATHMESLAWYFPIADGYRGRLVMHWGTLVLPLDVVVVHAPAP